MKSERVVSRMAFADISDHLKEEAAFSYGENDVWVVTPNALDTKETRKLNKELGLHKVNKTKSVKVKNPKSC